jgi:subtilase family serine protease
LAQILRNTGSSMAFKSLPRLLFTTAIFLGLTGFGVSNASAAVVHNRIAASANTGGFLAIPGSIHPKARLASDLGPMRGDARLQGMSIHFNMSTAQQAALDQLLADQQNPSSSRYHQWLSPEQYGEQFGLSSDDLSKVTAWLQSQGFTVTSVANGRSYITFNGTVAQAQAAFATSMHNVSLNGETHFANVTGISVPSQFSGVVTAVTGLHDFRLKARVHPSLVKPAFTSSVSGNHYTEPGDMYSVYNMKPLLSAGINGSGQTVAIIGQVDINLADVVAFRSASGLSTTNLPTTVHANNGLDDPGPPICTSCTSGPSQGDLTESSVDVEWAGAMAPAATILFVNARFVMPNAIEWAINKNLAPIVTSSYGLCEAGWGINEMVALNADFKQANAQGQTIVGVSADQGATDCDAGPTATEGLQVDFPGTSPYVTSMGGTMFNEGNATGATNYWLGADATFAAGTSIPAATYSATGYIPEAAWNDASIGAYGGSGGGASAFFTKPAWQVGTPADAARDVPDISLNASDGHDQLLFCVNVATGVSCGSGFRVSATNDTLDAEGGTSFDSQIFGGMLALIEQKNPPTNGLKGLGNINLTIYALGNNANFYKPGQTTATNSTVVFNDVTIGSNAMPCVAGTPNCGNGGTAGFNAVNGYDLATGWGSVNLTNLANDWALVTPIGLGPLGPDLSVTTLTQPTPSSVAVGTTVTLTAPVTGFIVTSTSATAGTITTVPGPTPTGTVQFLSNNVALGGGVAVTATGASSASATYSWVTSCSNLGQQVLTASYSGDSNYQGSIGPSLTTLGSATTHPVEVQVTSATCPDFGITPSAAGVTSSGNNLSVTVAAGGSIPAVTITATPTNNFTGQVTFSAVATTTSSSGTIPTFTFSSPTVTISSSSPVTTTLTLSGITADLRMPAAPGEQHKSGKAPWYAAGSGVAVASMLLIVLPRRRRLGGLLLVLLAIGLIGGASGCGGSQTTSTTTSSNTNPDAGTYTVTVIGTFTSSTGLVTEHVATVTYAIF